MTSDKKGPSCPNWGQGGGVRGFGQFPERKRFFPIEAFPYQPNPAPYYQSQSLSFSFIINAGYTLCLLSISFHNFSWHLWKNYTTKFTRVILGRPCHTITYRSNRLRHLMSFLAASSSPGLSSSTKYSLPLTSSSALSLLVCFVIGMCTSRNVAKRSVLRSVHFYSIFS